MSQQIELYRKLNFHKLGSPTVDVVFECTATGLKMGNATTQLMAFYNTTPCDQPSAYTQTYATADKTHANVTTAAVTDSTTGTVGTTLAAGVGVSIITIPIVLAGVSAADVLTDYTPGYKFKLLSASFAVTVPVTTAAKAATLNLEIGATNVTGGEIALTSANCTPLGALVAGAAITAANTGAANATISVEAASVTAFIEGQGVLLLKIQNMDTADAIASLSDQATKQKADVLDIKQLANSVIDDLQELGLVA